jgi:senataxin
LLPIPAAMAIEFSFGDDIEEACNRFLALPSETHLLCPRVSEDDDEDYDDLEEPGDVGTDEKQRRLEDFRSRVALVYQCSLIFGFEETSAASLQEQFKTRTSAFLQTCSHCVRTWHRNRAPFLKRLAE